jgi:hypothetical protein
MLMNKSKLEGVKAMQQEKRMLFLDTCDPSFKTHFCGQPLPRLSKLAKSHLLFPQLEKNIAQRRAKVVVGLHNPKDTLVSYYHFYSFNKALGCFTGTWDEFFELFRAKNLLYGDPIDWFVSWWTTKGKQDFLHVFYEDLSANPAHEIQRMAAFLDKPASEVDLTKILGWISFESMSNEKSVNYTDMAHLFDCSISQYMRKGRVGDWKNYFTEEQSRYVDKLVAEKCTPVGLKFRYSLE